MLGLVLVVGLVLGLGLGLGKGLGKGLGLGLGLGLGFAPHGAGVLCRPILIEQLHCTLDRRPVAAARQAEEVAWALGLGLGLGLRLGLGSGLGLGPQHGRPRR